MDFDENDDDEEGLDEKMRNDLKILEKQVQAKKDVLMEVLSTIENSEDEIRSNRRCRNIRQILSLEVICGEEGKGSSSSFSLKLRKIERFGNFTCATVELKNLDKDFDVIPEVFTQPLSSTCKWLVFDDEDSVNITGSGLVRKLETRFLLVAIPNSLFFDSERISLAILCKPVPENEKKLNPSFYSLMASKTLPTAQFSGVLIENFLNITVVDVNSLEFVGETEAQNTCRYILTCYNRQKLKIPQEFSDFRRRFPGFTCCDFDKWQVLIGTYQFNGLFVLSTSPNPANPPIIRNIYGNDLNTLIKFVSKLENENSI